MVSPPERLITRYTVARGLLREELADGVDGRLALDGGDGFEEGDFLGADLYAVAGLAAVGDAPFFHHRFEPLVLQGGAGGVVVEKAHLADHRSADELIDGRVLRASF